MAEIAHQPVVYLWHDSPSLENCDAILIPGGFAYGDYLRTGAIARFSPVMQSVRKFAADGGLVLGICNGFQILCEAGLLPGALMRNAGLHLQTGLSADGDDGFAFYQDSEQRPGAEDADWAYGRELLLR